MIEIKTETEVERARERERQRCREIETGRERQRDRERETQKEVDRDREREAGRGRWGGERCVHVSDGPFEPHFLPNVYMLQNIFSFFLHSCVNTKLTAPCSPKVSKNDLMRLKGTSKESLEVAPAAPELLAPKCLAPTEAVTALVHP